MDPARILSIACSVVLAEILRRQLVRYKRWKDSRTEIPTYRNWRGVWVPDLKLKRIERAVIGSLIALALFCMIFGYFLVTEPGVADYLEAQQAAQRP